MHAAGARGDEAGEGREAEAREALTARRNAGEADAPRERVAGGGLDRAVVVAAHANGRSHVGGGLGGGLGGGGRRVSVGAAVAALVERAGWLVAGRCVVAEGGGARGSAPLHAPLAVVAAAAVCRAPLARASTNVDCVVCGADEETRCPCTGCDGSGNSGWVTCSGISSFKNEPICLDSSVSNLCVRLRQATALHPPRPRLVSPQRALRCH